MGDKKGTIFGGLVEDITTPQRGEIQFDVTPPVIGVMPGSDNAVKSEESILPSGFIYHFLTPY